MKRRDPKRAVGYLRVSTDEQALGPKAQRAALIRYCEQRGIELVDVFEDIGISGAAELDRRPGLLAALGALAEAGAGVFLVHKRDRLARDPVVAGMVTRLVERGGSKVHAAEGVSNGDAPEDVLLRGIIDVFAAYERLVIKARTKAALGVKKARGERVGEIPFGYQLGNAGMLVARQDEQAVITRMRELREQRLSIRAIASRLNEENHPARGRCWHPTSVHNILRRAA
jgi:DNA invertase Pin-like site-specific DNA recombinase